MIGFLARRDGAVYLLLAVYFCVNLVARLAMPGTLEYDEGQQLFFGQWIAVGYDSQPPFYNWLQYGMIQLVGSSVLALALLKNVMLFSSYVLFGLTAHAIIRDRVLAVIATLALITFPQVGYEAQRDLSHTVALLFAACLFAFFFVRALQRPTAVNYALTGVAIGVGILSKYNFVLLPLAAALALLLEPEFRSRVFNVRTLLMLAVAAVIVAPHGLWFLDHVRTATGETIQKLNAATALSYPERVGDGIVSLAVAILSISLPPLAAFAITFGRTLLRAWREENKWTRLIGRTVAISLVAVALLVLAGGASSMKARWLLPFFFLLPIYICSKIESSGEAYPGAPRRFAAIILPVMVLVPLLIFSRPLLGSLLGDYNKHNVPFEPAISAILASNQHRPSIVLASDQQLAGNLRMHASDIPVAVRGYEQLERPFLFDGTHPVLVVWRGTGQPTPDPGRAILKWLNEKAVLAGRPLDVRDVAVPYRYGREGDVYNFNYAWIYPPGGQ